MCLCRSANSTARSKAPLCGSPVPTLSIVLTPASRARAITASRSESYSGPSMWQWESMNIALDSSVARLARGHDAGFLNSKRYRHGRQRIRPQEADLLPLLAQLLGQSAGFVPHRNDQLERVIA